MKELVYTSAPAGLRPGTSGFCTVAMTDGLSAAVVEFLERLSNTYRPVYMPYDPRAADNPVAYSLVRARAGGQPVVVLSRNAAAGTDHTGRSNNLAHHLVFESPGPGDGSNPAATAGFAGTFLTRWDGSPRRLPARSVPGSPGPRGLCRTWEEVTGDAGWAATVAAAWASRDGRPLYLIYPPEADVLSLLAEAIGLVPADRRWDCTFTTYYTGLSPEATCVVRAVLAGSPQEAEARRGDHIDLMDLDGPPPESVLAARARGRAVAEDVIPAPVAAPPLPARRAVMNAEPLAISPVEQVLPDEPPPLRAGRGQPVPEPQPARRTRKSGMRWAWLAVLVFGPLALLSLACGGIFGKYQMDQRAEAESARSEAESKLNAAESKRNTAESNLKAIENELDKAQKEMRDLERLNRGLTEDLGRTKEEIAKLKAPAPKSEKPDPKKPPVAGTSNPNPNQAQTLPDDFDDWMAKVNKLRDFGKKVVYYKRLQDAAGKAVLDGKMKIETDGGFDLQKELLPKDESQKGEKSKRNKQEDRQVLRLVGSNLFKEKPGVKPYEIVALYRCGTQAKVDQPTYLPANVHDVVDLKPIPIQYRPNETADDPLKRQFYFIEESELADLYKRFPDLSPEKRKPDTKWVFVIRVDVKPPEVRLLWLRNAPAPKSPEGAR